MPETACGYLELAAYPWLSVFFAHLAILTPVTLIMAASIRGSTTTLFDLAEVIPAVNHVDIKRHKKP